MEFVTLNTGAKMPLEGFGVFQVPDPAVCEQAVFDAIKTGYRLIDTAQAYMNEEAVGKAVNRAIADGITKAYKEGIVKAIGVSNFYPAILANLCENVEIIPAVNQVELHPFFQQENALATMKEYGIAP